MKKPYLANYVEEHMLNLLETKFESSNTDITETVEDSDPDEFELVHFSSNTKITKTIENSDPDEFNF